MFFWKTYNNLELSKGVYKDIINNKDYENSQCYIYNL